MEVIARLDAPATPDALFEWVADLERYPRWLDIVPRAVATAPDGDAPAWTVDLRGRLGPFARSKRLRMVRTQYDEPKSVVFERREHDDKSHSPWVLEAHVTEVADGSQLTMRLYYGGGLWGPLVERLLREEIEHSKPRLLALL